MTSKIKISGDVVTTDSTASLGLEIWLNHQLVFDQPWVRNQENFSFEFDDDEGQHELRFVMKNKTADHTQLGANGDLVRDACLVISNVTFDDIPLDHVITEKTVYSHNFNGSGPSTQSKFYGTLGCNGTVSLKFTTPMYLWLLENL
jgi:hypothetical protein